MSKNLISLSLAGIAILSPAFFSFSTVNAQSEKAQEQIDQIQQNRENLQEDLDQLQQNREELRQARCELATTKINNWTERYNEGQARYVNRYNALVDKLNNLLSLLEERELETGNLPAQIDSIQVMTNEFNNQVNLTVSLLEETKTLACGESEGAYLEKLQEARIQALAARTKAIEINNYFLTDVVEELKILRDQLSE